MSLKILEAFLTEWMVPKLAVGEKMKKCAKKAWIAVRFIRLVLVYHKVVAVTTWMHPAMCSLFSRSLLLVAPACSVTLVPCRHP